MTQRETHTKHRIVIDRSRLQNKVMVAFAQQKNEHYITSLNRSLERLR